MRHSRMHTARARRGAALLAVAALAALVAGCGESRVQDAEQREIVLATPADQHIARGDTSEIVIALSRAGFDGPVAIRFEELPKGVHVAEQTTELSQDEASRRFTLVAEDDAELVDGDVARVVALGPDGMSVAQQFRVNVVAAK